VVDSLRVNEENEHNMALCSTQPKFTEEALRYEISVLENENIPLYK
jgi:hypothetical protein